MTMPSFPQEGYPRPGHPEDPPWTDWAQAVHDAATEVVSGRLTTAAQAAASVAAVEDADEVAPTGAWDFAQAPTVAGAPIDGGGGITDHGALTGLADDDHPQYLNQTRGDARYVQGTDGRLTDARTPTDGSVTNAKVAPGAAIALSKLATDPLARANHTGTQPAASISDLTEAAQDAVAAFLVAGVGVTVSHDDVANTFTINATGGGGTTDPEIVRDVIGTALVASSGIQITVNDAGDSITIASTAVLPTRQVIAGTGLSGGGDLSADRTLAVTYGTTASTAAQGNDSRLSDARTPLAHTHPASAISDSTTVGRSVLTAADAAAARTAIGAGTSNLAIGTTSATAKAGDYSPPADAAAGTASMRTLGTGALQAAAGNDSRFTNARTPTAHASTHATGGSDLLTPAAIGAAPVSALWAPSTAYTAGQLVVNAGQVYAAAVSHTSGASFVASNWTAINPGELGYAQIVSNFDTTVGAGVDVTGLSVTVTVGTRPILLDFAGYLTNLSANVYTIAQLWDATANVQLVECAWNFPTASVVDRKTASIRVSPAAGTRTYKMRLSCTGGTARIAGSAASPAYLMASQV